MRSARFVCLFAILISMLVTGAVQSSTSCQSTERAPYCSANAAGSAPNLSRKGLLCRADLIF